jgi:predicted transcriptional regulator
MRTIEDKVWDYLVEHKAPVSIEALAKRFIVSKSRVGMALRKLVERQVVDCIKIGNKHFHKIKD